jgi:protein-S-isoprenylcysteine O-methyltransferase Ste14
VFISIFTLLTVIRAYCRIATRAFREPLYADREEWHFIALRGLFGIPLVAATALYVLNLSWAPWPFVRFPAWLRRKDRLVTTGPYRFVRHPMYAAYLLLFSGAFLLSANWVICAGGVGVILTLMTLRLAGEDRRLAERFDGAWLSYRETTGAFLPRLRLPVLRRACRAGTVSP